MAVVIRLQRRGRKQKPYYRIVAVDSRKSGGSESLEILGFYDPSVSDANSEKATVPASQQGIPGLTLKKDIAQKWLKLGAKPSKHVHRLFLRVQAYPTAPQDSGSGSIS
jgi:small subunit ribosomal protein S16